MGAMADLSGYSGSSTAAANISEAAGKQHAQEFLSSVGILLLLCGPAARLRAPNGGWISTRATGGMSPRGVQKLTS